PHVPHLAESAHSALLAPCHSDGWQIKSWRREKRKSTALRRNLFWLMRVLQDFVGPALELPPCKMMPQETPVIGSRRCPQTIAYWYGRPKANLAPPWLNSRSSRFPFLSCCLGPSTSASTTGAVRSWSTPRHSVRGWYARDRFKTVASIKRTSRRRFAA